MLLLPVLLRSGCWNSLDGMWGACGCCCLFTSISIDGAFMSNDISHSTDGISGAFTSISIDGAFMSNDTSHSTDGIFMSTDDIAASVLCNKRWTSSSVLKSFVGDVCAVC